MLFLDSIDTRVLNAKQLSLLRTHFKMVKPKGCKQQDSEAALQDKLGSSLQAVVRSVTKACSLFRERLKGGPSSFRNFFSQACRHVNDYYGPLSREFKTWWVKQAMKSWGRHWCGDHSNCSGISWYTFCHIVAPTGTPVADGDFSAPSFKRCKLDALEIMYPGVSNIFQHIVTAATSSYKFVAKLYDAVLYGHTYANESFFHMLQIMVSQTLGTTHDFYKMRAIVAMLEWNWQREWKILGQGTLRKNKHSTTMVRNQHLPRITGPRLEIIKRVLSSLYKRSSEEDPRGVFREWCIAQSNYLVKKRSKREAYMVKASEKYKKQIEIFRTICPVKSEELVSERKGPAFVKYQTRPPMPFVHTDERTLGAEEAETLLQLGHQAREFHVSVERRRLDAIISNNQEKEVEDEDVDVIDILVRGQSFEGGVVCENEYISSDEEEDEKEEEESQEQIDGIGSGPVQKKARSNNNT